MPMVFATAAIPAGVCSNINLKSCHCTIGLAAICVACSLSVFIACCGFSDAAAKPPKPLTSLVVFLVPTAASCEYVDAISDALYMVCCANLVNSPLTFEISPELLPI